MTPHLLFLKWDKAYRIDEATILFIETISLMVFSYTVRPLWSISKSSILAKPISASYDVRSTLIHLPGWSWLKKRRYQCNWMRLEWLAELLHYLPLLRHLHQGSDSTVVSADAHPHCKQISKHEHLFHILRIRVTNSSLKLLVVNH